MVGWVFNLWSWCLRGFPLAGCDPSYVVGNESLGDTVERSPRDNRGGFNTTLVRSTTPSFLHTSKVVEPLKYAMHVRYMRRRW